MTSRRPLVSPGDFKDADQADLELLTNDANNFMVSNFARTLAGEVRTSVSEEVGTETASAMIAGFVDIHSSMGDAADGAKKLYDGTLSLGDGVLTLADGTTKLVDGSGELSEGSVKLKDGTSQLSGGLQDLLAGQKKLSNGASDLADGTGELATGADKLSKGPQTMQAKTKSLPNSVSQLNDGTQSAKGAADQLATGSRQVADGNQQLATTADEAISVINQPQADTDQRLENVKTDAQARLDQLVADGTLSAEQAKAIKSTISQSVEESALPNALESKVDQVNSGLSSMQSKLHALADGSEKVADGNQQLATGLGTLAEGTKKLDAAVPSLVDGISSAADGSAALATGAHSANDGAKKLAAGEKSALAGTSQAAGGAKALDEGAGTLVQGTDALHGGLVKLSDGVGDLSKGAGQLEDGSSQLSSGLHDGVKQVPNPDQKTSDQLADVIGSPVALDNVKQAEAQSYGAGLAPFFMTLATYIGVLVLTQVMRPITKRALLSNGSNWKISIGGWPPFAAIAVVQTSLLYAAVHFGLGLTTAHPWMAWLLLVCAALCFSALIQGFFALLGTAGKFLVLVLMVLRPDHRRRHLPLGDPAGAAAVPAPDPADGQRGDRHAPPGVRGRSGRAFHRARLAADLHRPGLAAEHARGAEEQDLDPEGPAAGAQGMTTPASQRRRVRATDSKERIFEAAMTLLGTRAPEAVSVDQIAAAAGVSKGTVYYNFGSKDELISQILDFGAQKLMDELNRAAAGPQTLPGAEAHGGIRHGLRGQLPGLCPAVDAGAIARR
ncbi:YhgE/Pip family protein [Glutamicibacter halophytocola]|uniref:YhgE/Pip family protein n=1 Tax=Glutamicibacter halophytocola TaxID=1933880 RepID=UPI00321B4C91